MIYKASIIGLGNIAWKYDKGISDSYVRTHAECYLKDAKTNLKGGVSPCKKELDEFTDYYHLEKYKNIEYLLKDKQDIVSICSPSEFHFQQVKRCILSGVPMIWLEKPATTNIYELEELIDLADKFNTQVLVNYQRRYCSNYINRS